MVVGFGEVEATLVDLGLEEVLAVVGALDTSATVLLESSAGGSGVVVPQEDRPIRPAAKAAPRAVLFIVLGFIVVGSFGWCVSAGRTQI